METPFNKIKGSAFRKYNIFTSSPGKVESNEFIFNSNLSKNDNYNLLTNSNFSFRKFIRSSDKKETFSRETENKKTPICLGKENFHKLNIKKSSFRINNVNFNIDFSYLKLDFLI